MRTSPRVRLSLAVFTVALAAASAGCRHKAKTPADGYKRLVAAVTAGDGGALFDALDQETRWNWMSIQKFHREAYDIVLSNYPEGEIRERETRRFEHAATAPSARDLFIVDAAPTVLPSLRPLMVQGAPIEAGTTEDTAAAVTPAGARVELKRSKDGDWGYGGLAKRAEEDKNRAYQDLELVRASAADFERAAARAGK
ncbi:MAG TPA: hypothetical protein VN903_20950 [Polyangia bacterium]|jgi:hypothetical protein|nr:hypothetical protein [Polyangia bacterium]